MKTIPEVHIIMNLAQKSLVEHNFDKGCMCRTAFGEPCFVFILYRTM